jgi:hypothetical protein
MIITPDIATTVHHCLDVTPGALGAGGPGAPAPEPGAGDSVAPDPTRGI